MIIPSQTAPAEHSSGAVTHGIRVHLRDASVARWLLALAAVLAIAFCFANRRFYEDDALITLRYCRNMLQGNGIVWNVGERVEGYSNFLYLVLVAGLGYLDVDLRLASQIVGISAYFGVVAVVYAYGNADRRVGRSTRAAIPVIAVVTSCPLIVWSLGGLEGSLCALLAVVAVALVARCSSTSKPFAFAGAGALFALAAMTRLDASLFALSSIPALLAIHGPRRGAPAVAALSAAFLAIYAPYFIWRYGYYSSLFPNTVYAKGTSTDLRVLLAGARYVAGVLLRPPALGVWIAIASILAWRRRALSRPFFYVASVALGYMAFPIIAGGDHMAASRFMVPVIPVLALVLYEAVVSAGLACSPTAGLPLGAGLLACCALQGLFERVNPVHADPAAYLGTIIGDYVEGHWPSRALVATNAAGALPYEAKDLRFLDMLGLNDKHIAHAVTRHYKLARAEIPGHRKGDGDYVLTRRPEFIIFGPPEGTPLADPWWVSDYEIELRRAEFERIYRREEVEIDATHYDDYRSFPASASGKIHFVYYRLIPELKQPLTGKSTLPATG